MAERNPIEQFFTGARTPRVAIIGAGVGGLCASVKLREQGVHSFVLLEKADRLGGTWRDNTYPGCCVDVASPMYSFSFEQRSDWPNRFSAQPEILAYLNSVADRHDLRPHIKYDTEVERSEFDEDSGTWRIRTKAGETIVADVVIAATGQLNRPKYPDIPGLEDFQGVKFHSARWHHGHSLAGERVAVIGNGASAAQFIPEIQKEVGQLKVFQRTPNWIIPRNDRRYSDWEHWLLKNLPPVRWLYRFRYYAEWEAWWMNFHLDDRSRKFEALIRSLMEAQIPDPEMRRKLIPTYAPGCKRLIITDDFLPALQAPNVEVITDRIERVTATGIVTADGREHAVDTLIFGTGFESNDFLAPMDFIGRDGRSLQQEWKNGAYAYLGMTVAGFPNFFILYGPNTNLGHNSIIFMIERQVEYVRQCIATLHERGLRYLDVRADAQREFNEQLQKDLGNTVWAGGCQSWYKNEDGKIVNNWSKTTLAYWWNVRKPDFSKYVLAVRNAAEQRNAA